MAGMFALLRARNVSTFLPGDSRRLRSDVVGTHPKFLMSVVIPMAI